MIGLEKTTLNDLRQRLNDIDRRLLFLVAERKAVSVDVARVKRASGYPTRDPKRESEVILGARAMALELQVSPALAEELLRLLIRESLATQEQASVAARGTGIGRRALVIGGSGRMGRWFVQFLSSQGFTVEVADPRDAPAGVARVNHWHNTDLKHDYIVLTTPVAVTDTILRDLASRRPTGVIFDICSLKAPLRAGLLALKSRGWKVTSINPLFGPDTELLSGRQVVFVDLACTEALQGARELFAPTMAEQVVMGLENHDRFVAYAHGLPHAIHMAFAAALAEIGAAGPKLPHLSGIAFDALVDVTSRITQESARSYYEIQRMNDYAAESLDALAKAMDGIRAAVSSEDPDMFVDKMRRGPNRLEDQSTV
jgi:chorismate mutase/prephenate dehydrogenase